MSNSWHYIKEDGYPKIQGRYLVAYRREGSADIKYFTGDFLYDGNGFHWYVMYDTVEVIAYQEIEPFVLPDETHNPEKV